MLAEVFPGAIGALLRREGLYSSHLTTWRQQREKGELNGLAPKKRGRKVNPINPLSGKVRELEVENRRLKKQLDRAETIISFQKNRHEPTAHPRIMKAVYCVDDRSSQDRELMVP